VIRFDNLASLTFTWDRAIRECGAASWRQFFSSVRGCEVASLHFGAVDQSLFVTIQHPGEPGTGPNSANSSFETPTSVWSDDHTPPRPSVVVVTKRRGIGSPVIGSL